MPFIIDDDLKLFYSFDESGPYSVRRNTGSVGTLMDLSVYKDDDDSKDGMTPVPDEQGGKAMECKVSDGFTSRSHRGMSPPAFATDVAENVVLGAGYLSGLLSEDEGYMPRADEMFDGLTERRGFSFGVRWKHDGTTGTSGGSDAHQMWGWSAMNTGSGPADGPFSFAQAFPSLGMELAAGTNLTNPQAAYSMKGLWEFGSSGVGTRAWAPGAYFDDIGVANGWDAWPLTPDPYGNGSLFYPNIWYRAVVTYWQELDGPDMKLRMRVFIYREDNGERYILDLVAPPDVAETCRRWVYSAGLTAAKFGVGWDETNFEKPLEGWIDELWFREQPYIDPDDVEDFIVTGISVPWTAPNPEVLANKVRVAVTNERSDFPPTRPLPTGATAVDHPAGSYGTRPRLRYEGYEANRPWDISSIEMLFDSGGRRRGKMGNRFEWDDFTKGLVRLPGRKPPGVMADVRNMEFSGLGARRRRGYEIIRKDAARGSAGAGGFFSWRNTDDELHRVVLTGGILYQDVGNGLQAISTGWNETRPPSFTQFRDICVIIDGLGGVVWDGATETAFAGEPPPTTGVQNLTTGTLDGDYYYAYTFYNPTTGEETAPYLFGSQVSPSTQGIILSSLDTTPGIPGFTHQRFYRTVSGGAAPQFYLTAVQALAASYTDSGDADGVIAIDHVNGVYTTNEPQENFAFSVEHAGRMFFAGGANGDRVYRSEASTWSQFQPDAYTAHSGTVRAIASRGPQLVVWTDRAVEVVESDWIRDANGAAFATQTVISNVVGAPSHGAVIDASDEIYWLDQRGVYTLRGDKVQLLSPLIQGWLRGINWGKKKLIKGAWNHTERQVMWTLAHAEQDYNNYLNTQLVLQMDRNQFSLYDMNAAWVGQYDDDLDGMKFGVMDEFGMWKEFGTFESDGVETVGAEHSGTITAYVNNDLTDDTQAWTVNQFQGYGLVLVDANGDTAARMIVSNTADTLRLNNAVPTNLIAGDAYYIGGINAWFELAEAHMGSSNRKISRSLHTELSDLTRNDNR